ncbi:hypothetical protein [Ramlibacter sp. AN1133]|uniref:hypothetical protein n=1 Tax=Ramlibacter sp. AN1133 TaxID=3133429 RepID=UPI0030BF46D7
MSSGKLLPLKVRNAAARFRKTRADYYEWMADLLEASQGELKIQTLFERDAQRYPKQARGILADHWATTFGSNGGNLADAWQGTLPDDEVTIIRISQNAGDDALRAALRDVGRVARLGDKVKSAVWGTLFAGIFGVSVAAVMLTVFPIFASAKLQDIYGFIPVEEWGSKGKALVHHAERVKSLGIYVLFALGLLLTYVQWTMNNITGAKREWLDNRIVLYRVMRDIKGALFLATMATLTRRRGNTMFTLHQSLTVFVESARSAWLRWRVQQIVDRIDQFGATDAESFNTNLLSPPMYYYLRDTQEARGFAEGFEETGKYVEKTILDGLIKRLTVYRWALLMLAVISVAGVVGWMVAIPYEMKGVMQMYFSSR